MQTQVAEEIDAIQKTSMAESNFSQHILFRAALCALGGLVNLGIGASGSISQIGDSKNHAISAAEVQTSSDLRQTATALTTRVRVIRFEVNSASLDRFAINALRLHAVYMREHSGLNLLLVGHTDERGSAEFNLGIGGWRADRVKNVLVRMGVPQHRIETASLGEHRPIDSRHNEFAWKLNRRVEFVYMP